jgi:hypothetical protein
MTVQGWATIMVCILFLGGVQLICIGIMGEYIARIFTHTKQRLIYIVEEIYSARNNKSDEQAILQSASEYHLEKKVRSF